MYGTNFNLIELKKQILKIKTNQNHHMRMKIFASIKFSTFLNFLIMFEGKDFLGLFSVEPKNGFQNEVGDAHDANNLLALSALNVVNFNI